MNYLLAFFLVLISFAGHAQAWQSPLPYDSVTHKITYSGVVQVPGATQDDLYTRGRSWFATEFRSAASVLQMDDKEAGQLIGKGNTSFTFNAGRLNPTPIVSFTLSVALKEGRYRYELTNLNVEGQTTAQSTPVEVGLAHTQMLVAKEPKSKTTQWAINYIVSLDRELGSVVKRLEMAMSKPAGRGW